MACDAQSVATDSAAFLSLNEKHLAGMQVYLLAQWAKQLNPALDVTPQALMTASTCYTQCMSGKWLYGAMVYLLCQIEAGGGGAGTDYLLVYDNQAALPAAPADQTKVWIARFRDGSAGKTWDPVNLVWF